MKISRPKSYTRYNNNSFQNNFSQTSSGFFRLKNMNDNSKNYRILSGNSYAIKCRPKLFSLLDINDKITNCRGTSLPIQFKRLTDEETQRHFGFSYREDQNYKLSLIRNFLNNMHPSKYKDKKNNNNKLIEENKKNNNIKNNNKNEVNNTNKKLEIKIDDNNKNNILEEIKKDNKMETDKNKINNNINIKKDILQKKNESNQNKMKIKNRNDRWLPEGYPQYELLVNNPKLFIKKLQNDFFGAKLPDNSLKIIKKKSYDSDIFFSKSPTSKESFYNKKIKQHNHQTSDIFNLNYDEKNLLKTSENFLFKTKPKDYYYLTRESNSKWSPKLSIPTLVNCPSIEYNILNPGNKNIALTKDKVLTEIESKKRKNAEEKKLDKNIIESVNYMNPIFRQKGLAEFIDITRNGGNNTGKDFIDCYNKNPRCFCKNNETCSTFYNSYVFYKDICNKPFILDPSLKLK